jgi:putative transposase
LAERAGREFVRVDPRGTSQTCSDCGVEVPKDLAVRVHRCPHCGYAADRDVNAACNILRLGRSHRGVVTDRR